MINDKTSEFKKNIEIKDKNYEKLLKSLKEVQKETKEIDSKYTNRAGD